MKAAIPDYMQEGIDHAAAGHRFGMYFKGWNDDWTLAKEKKSDSLAIQLQAEDQQRRDALIERQQAQCACLDDVLILSAKSSAPFVTGLGIDHPVENGFAFLSPYGLPYLPGASIKGVLRAAAMELEMADDVIATLFGREGDDPESYSQGCLCFWDVYPKGALAVEIITPHHGDYLQKNGVPHDSEKPIPNPFLCIEARATFMFVVHRHRSAHGCEWRTIVQQCFDHAFNWLGFGGKTAVGYGAMKEESNRSEAINSKLAQARNAMLEQARQEAMSDEDKELAQLKQQEPNWSDNGTFLSDVEAYLGTHEHPCGKVVAFLEQHMEEKYKGIMNNPHATQGKKATPKFKPRPIALAERLCELKKGVKYD